MCQDIASETTLSDIKSSPPPSPQSSEVTEVTDTERVERPTKQMRSVSSQTEGTVTIITVGNPPNAVHPSGTVSVKSMTLPPSGGSSQHSLTRLSGFVLFNEIIFLGQLLE